MAEAIFLLIMFATPILFTISALKKRNPPNKKYYPAQPIVQQAHPNLNRQIPEYMVKNQILKNNPSFSEDNFKRFTEMIYVRYLASITKKDMTNVEAYLHKDMCQIHKEYLDTIKLANRNIQIENIIVGGIFFLEYKSKNNVETIKMHVKSSMNHYEADDMNRVISGYRSRVIQRQDILTFQRDYGQLHAGHIAKCPNCMATLKALATKCEYCGATIKFDDNTNDGWLLCDITTLS